MSLYLGNFMLDKMTLKCQFSLMLKMWNYDLIKDLKPSCKLW